jgi:hypothetical protein
MSFAVLMGEKDGTFYVAVDSATQCGVFAMSLREAERYVLAITRERIKNTPVPGEQVAGTFEACQIFSAHMSRVSHPEWPMGRSEYDDGEVLYRRVRRQYVCPWTGQTWLVEECTVVCML